MDPTIYTQMSEIEDSHWWFVARRFILNKLITDLELPSDATILDAGCGTGGNISMLNRHGQVFPMEVNERARKIALDLRGIDVQSGSLPTHIPFDSLSFDLIVLLDVLEHLEDDIISLKSLRERLNHNGWLLITVPAYPWLWSRHDDSNHHKRRYVLKELVSACRQSGFQVQYVSYFNSLLFPLIVSIRLLKNIFKFGSDSDLSMPPKLINQTLKVLFSSEHYVLKDYSFPFGVSIVMLAQKR